MTPKDDETVDSTLVGVCIAYCESGTLKKVWLNLNAVQAIAWGTGKINNRAANPPHVKQQVPAGKEPTSCPPGVKAAGGAPVCWWTGAAWVCGEA